MKIDLRDEYGRLIDFYDETERMLDEPDTCLFEVNTSVSGWSMAQHLYHIWLSNGRSLKAVEVIGRGSSFATEEGDLNDAGRFVLTKERMPRGRMQAPAMVAPPDDLDRDGLETSFRRSRGKLADVSDLLPILPEATGRIPHPALGTLNAAQWLRFIRIHSHHHLAIIHDIVGQAA